MDPTRSFRSVLEYVTRTLLSNPHPQYTPFNNRLIHNEEMEVRIDPKVVHFLSFLDGYSVAVYRSTTTLFDRISTPLDEGSQQQNGSPLCTKPPEQTKGGKTDVLARPHARIVPPVVHEPARRGEHGKVRSAEEAAEYARTEDGVLGPSWYGGEFLFGEMEIQYSGREAGGDRRTCCIWWSRGLSSRHFSAVRPSAERSAPTPRAESARKRGLVRACGWA
jgi:hypothetical protein